MLLSRRGSAAPSALPPLLLDAVNDGEQRYRHLDSKAAILHKLREMAGQRAPLKLQVFSPQGDVHTFHSSISRLDLENELLILHQLLPASWRDVVSDGQAVAINSYLQSGLVMFDSRLAPLEHSAYNPFCSVQIPQLIHIQQLRGAFRVTLLPNTGKIEMTIGHETHKGACLDISLTGCCGQFPLDLADTLDAMKEPPEGWHLRFWYGDEELFETHAKLRRQRNEATGVVTVGLHFPDDDKERAQKLQPLLLTLQRERLRLHPRLDDV